jgi:hypothetical protein
MLARPGIPMVPPVTSVPETLLAFDSEVDTEFFASFLETCVSVQSLLLSCSEGETQKLRTIN